MEKTDGEGRRPTVKGGGDVRVWREERGWSFAREEEEIWG